MSKYDEMSDLEINKLVAIALRDKSCVHMMGEHVMMWSGNPKSDDSGYQIFNPCNNPADMWPIILKHGLIVDGNGSAISTDENGYQFIVHDKNPLRAAAIVFLMMKDAE